MSTGARVLGFGTYRPVRVVTNDDLAQRVVTSDEWIRSRTGIATRRIADADETTVMMGAAAAEKALAAAGITADDVELVITATCTSPSQIPGAAPQIAHRIGANAAGALDINAGCAGFCYALSQAADTVRAGTARHVLVVATEKLSDYVDWDDRSTCILLADGAGAAVVGPGERDEIGPAVWGHDGSRPDVIRVPGHGDNLFRMEGQAVFRWAITLVPALRRICERAGVAPEELAGIVPHQANLRIIEALVNGLGAKDAVVARDVVDSGNTSAASIPLALSRLLDAGELRRGDPVLLFGFGAGLTYCGQVIRCP
ncbi:ketoacyl-ACP synthase III [Frankia sp. CNm7]|uniref:Beta-ketoacyl-[acyl-carrier-protein] synthase III n=1 Tax=Frankia nepalensis TaxID=1836974 RepID=A0A937REA6_9ACTN|nr:beta-ketoacyl-ACP synthase III [Frankia nepalensis]MBL7498197.1 ketoacyl-ACP synthase III [Frankia nepalensis]MBL7515922.1 ketoacyl-ACP synthase III [Frankia nepalensis]MBL7522227.1 ketoacyl-ACP synthase III [Frankia nepalensis]MBL7628407.1 ketoacyl-ACP synthase III [Frankia nepalensis]